MSTPYVPARGAILLDCNPADIRRAERAAVEFIRDHLDGSNSYERDGIYELLGEDLKKALAYAFLSGQRKPVKP